MIKKVKLSHKDRSSLALRSIETAPINTDLSKMVVNKPWGYEYLLTNTPLTEVWHLSLDHLKSTSTHCHPNKKTALVILDGQAEFSTLNKKINLSALDAVIIDAGVFHSTKCISKSSLKLLEIETPPMKHDLVRLSDKYGRANEGYEGREKMQIMNSSYIRFKSEDIHLIKNFCNNNLCIHFIENDNNLNGLAQKSGLAIVLNGFIKSSDNEILYGVGDVLEIKKLKSHNINLNNVSLLSISTSSL
jgi:mannose-6-phosphate isomerase-like protein (cupin superfamily)